MKAAKYLISATLQLAIAGIFFTPLTGYTASPYQKIQKRTAIR
jgi:hypothetical protein